MNRRLVSPKVEDILTKSVMTIHSSVSPVKAVCILNKYRISAIPVVNEQKELVGILSESDCLKYLSNSLFYDETKIRNIEFIMSNKVLVAEKDWDIFELESFFTINHLRSAPVIDDKGHLVGIVSRRDALVALEKTMVGREQYKKEIKTPIELSLREKAKIILNRINY